MFSTTLFDSLDLLDDLEAIDAGTAGIDYRGSGSFFFTDLTRNTLEAQFAGSQERVLFSVDNFSVTRVASAVSAP